MNSILSVYQLNYYGIFTDISESALMAKKVYRWKAASRRQKIISFLVTTNHGQWPMPGNVGRERTYRRVGL